MAASPGVTVAETVTALLDTSSPLEWELMAAVGGVGPLRTVTLPEVAVLPSRSVTRAWNSYKPSLGGSNVTE